MTENTGTIPADVQSEFSGDGEASGFDAFMANLEGEDPRKRASTSDGEAKAGDAGDAPSEATETDPEGTPKGDESEPSDPNDPDNAEVEIKVGEETKKATLRDLKRLYGQEAALTRKSQAVAESARVAEAVSTRATVALKGLLDRAQERYKPYADLDMLVLAQRMDTETFEQLRKDAAAAEADVKYISGELDGHVQATQQRQTLAHQEAAKVCVATLSDPKEGIPGWGQPLYTELMTFARARGLPGAANIVDPNGIKVLHMAYLYARSQSAAAAAAKKVQAAPAKPSNTMRPGQGRTNTSRATESLKALRASGSVDDAADAFLASFAA